MATMPDSFGTPPRGGGSATGKVICPRCWHSFNVDGILAIAQHPELVGDPVLGPNEPLRFLPSRFTPEGQPIDAHGVPCLDLACPRCRLVIPKTLTGKRPLFFSIIGAPASGKSFLLTVMVWNLRGLMPREFGFAFGDVDPTSNEIINDYEQMLFLGADRSAPTTLDKTDIGGKMYDRVRWDGREHLLPRPLMFSLQPLPQHPWHDKMKSTLEQTLVLYDNAGEHFQPRAPIAGTQHLVQSNGIFFVFDPSKERRFRERCKSDDPQMKPDAAVERQDILLSESIARIKRHSGLAGATKLDRPLIVVVTKYDIWQSLLKRGLPKPWRQPREFATAVLDVDAIGVTSFAIRHLFMQLCPEVVATAEAFSSKVTYVPTSALGHSPFEGRNRSDPNKRSLMVRPEDIRPIWATVPMLYMLSHFGMIPKVKRKKDDQLPVASDCQLRGKAAVLNVPGTKQRLEVPAAYLGRVLRCPETGTVFWVPSAQEIGGAATATE